MGTHHHIQTVCCPRNDTVTQIFKSPRLEQPWNCDTKEYQILIFLFKQNCEIKTFDHRGGGGDGRCLLPKQTDRLGVFFTSIYMC